MSVKLSVYEFPVYTGLSVGPHGLKHLKSIKIRDAPQKKTAIKLRLNVFQRQKNLQVLNEI